MAYVDIGSKVIQAYLHGLASRQKQDQEEAELKARIEAQKAQQEQAKASLDEQKRQFDASHAIAKVTADFQHQQALSNMQRNAAETGLTPPGSTVTEEVQGPSDIEAFNRALDLNNQPISGAQGPTLQRTYNLPNEMGSFQAPDPISHAINRARLAEIGNQPQVKAAIDIATGTEKVKQPGRIELETLKASDALKKAQQEQENKIQLRKLADIAAGERADDRNDAMLEAARIRSRAILAKTNVTQAEKLSAAEELKPSFMDGSSTFEELPKGNEGLLIRGQLAKEGYRVIPKKDKEALEGLGTVRQIISIYDKLNAAYKSHGIQSIVSPEVKDLEDRASALAGIMSRLYGGERGVLTEKDVQRVQGARPSKINSLFDQNRNDARMSDLRKFYNEKVTTTKGTMTPQQSSAIDNRFKLTLDSEASSDRVNMLLKKHGVK